MVISISISDWQGNITSNYGAPCNANDIMRIMRRIRMCALTRKINSFTFILYNFHFHIVSFHFYLFCFHFSFSFSLFSFPVHFFVSIMRRVRICALTRKIKVLWSKFMRVFLPLPTLSHLIFRGRIIKKTSTSAVCPLTKYILKTLFGRR